MGKINPKALDLFCGLGGMSDGLATEGFEVLGVEIDPRIAGLYDHPVIVADVRDLDPTEFAGYDLIVGSPPCRDFSSLARMWGHTWKRPPDPEGVGLSLVNAFLNFIAVAKPKFWIMENVPGLCSYLELQPRFKVKLGQTMKRCFWGNFPSFLVPRDMNKKPFFKRDKNRMRRRSIRHKKILEDVPGWLSDQWERARIPLPFSRALGKAVFNELRAEPHG